MFDFTASGLKVVVSNDAVRVVVESLKNLFALSLEALDF